MPLAFTVFSITNRSQGGDPGYAIGNLLEDEQRDFGSAVQRIEVTLHHEGYVSSAAALDRIKGPMRAVAAMLGSNSDFPPHEGKTSVRFERQRQRLLVDVISKRITPDEAASCRLTRDLIARGFDDVIDALEWAFAERITPQDDFDTDACITWMRSVRAREYPSDKALIKAEAAARTRLKERFDAKDPWDKLFIEWDEVHPDARTILDDPMDWQGGEFSPHGNDAGADIFNDWDEFRGLHPLEAGQRMDLPPLTDDLPDYIWKEWVDVHLAMAFGHIKKDAHCPPETAAATIAIINRDVAAKSSSNWKHRDAWLERLNRYRGILERFA